MKKTILIAIVAIVAGLLLVSCGNSNKKEAQENTTEQVEASHYQCPMQCEGDKVYEKSGVCPVCEMDLELVSGDNHDHHQH